jgi:hypothetical protein
VQHLLGLMAVGGWANQASIRPYQVQTREQAEASQKITGRLHALIILG